MTRRFSASVDAALLRLRTDEIIGTRPRGAWRLAARHGVLSGVLSGLEPNRGETEFVEVP